MVPAWIQGSVLIAAPMHLSAIIATITLVRGGVRPESGRGGLRGDAHASLYPEEHYHDKRIRLPADKDAELVFLGRIIDEGEGRGWKLVSAVKQPGTGVLWVTWDTSGSSSG